MITRKMDRTATGGVHVPAGLVHYQVYYSLAGDPAIYTDQTVAVSPRENPTRRAVEILQERGLAVGEDSIAIQPL